MNAHAEDDLANDDEYYAADISSETSGDEGSGALSYGTIGSDTSNQSLPLEEEADLPPPDRGKAAWLTLIGCFWLDGLVWGM